MIPLGVIRFDAPQPGAAANLFYSVTENSVGLVCNFQNSQGVLWLTGPDAGKPSLLESMRGFYLPVELEAYSSSHLTGTTEIPNLSLLKSAASTAVKSSSATGGARYYTVAGPAFGEPTVFAAFSRWQAVIEANGTRHILVRNGEEVQPDQRAE